MKEGGVRSPSVVGVEKGNLKGNVEERKINPDGDRTGSTDFVKATKFKKKAAHARLGGKKKHLREEKEKKRSEVSNHLGGGEARRRGEGDRECLQIKSQVRIATSENKHGKGLAREEASSTILRKKKS